ncbi:MAG: DUF4229 domain-containing protein [Flavobacteriales bacterium]|nr:DUF4229 domain-containing protein [Flavobacteriales bacterium]
MSEDHNISEDQFNELINEAFRSSDGMDDSLNWEDVSDVVFNKQYDVGIDAAKKQKMLGRLAGFSGPSLWVLLIGLVIGGLLSFLLFDKTGEEENVSAGNKTKNEYSEVSHPDKIQKMKPKGPGQLKIYQDLMLNDSFPLEGLLVEHTPEAQELKVKKEHSSKGGQTKAIVFDSTMVKYFSALKMEMIDKIIRMDTNMYTLVLGGNINYIGKNIGIDRFYLRNTPVSNLEYKIFLYDIYRKGMIEQFNMANVVEGSWKLEGYKKLEKEYFYNEKYNLFPVVNVPKEGMILFCQWMQNEIEVQAKYQKIELDRYKVRLPRDVEWIRAAYIGYADVLKCSGFNTIFDVESGYVNKKFEAKVAKNIRKHRPLMVDDYEHNLFLKNERQLLKNFAKAEVYQEDYYFVEGNRLKAALEQFGCAELIVGFGSNEPLVSGMCWKSKLQYLEMVNQYNLMGVSPFVSFRPVIVFDEEQDRDNPFW